MKTANKGEKGLGLFCIYLFVYVTDVSVLDKVWIILMEHSPQLQCHSVSKLLPLT